MAEAVDFWKFVLGAGQFNKLVGKTFDLGAMAPANTIAPTSVIHGVIGTGLVKTITPPDPSYTGLLILLNLATAVLTWDATGNIALASGAAQTVGKATVLVYSPGTGKWYPFLTAAG